MKMKLCIQIEQLGPNILAKKNVYFVKRENFKKFKKKPYLK